MTARYSQQIVNIMKRIETLKGRIVALDGEIVEQKAKLQDILDIMGVPTAQAALEAENARLLKQAQEVADAAASLPTDG
jgi:predicted  nucleic acid-binding Zn-ribbon protein